MELARIRKTDLARNLRQILRAVQRGQAAVIENRGQAEAALIDITDYHILRAVMHYYAQSPEIDAEAGLSEQEVKVLTEPETRYNVVFAHYLSGAISLARAAELLGLSWLDLRNRCLRLDVPLRTGPADLAEAKADVQVAMTIEPRS